MEKGTTENEKVASSSATAPRPSETIERSAGFPNKLMSIIEGGEFPDAIQWDATGTAFGIQPETFSSKVLEDYFQGCKFGSFSRKLSRWGFARTLGECPLQGRYCVYSHDLFQKNKPHLLERFFSRSAALNKSLQTKKTRAVPPAAEAGMTNSHSISARKPEPVARDKVPVASTPRQRADALERFLQTNPTAKQASAILLLQQAAANEALNQRRAIQDSMALLRSNNLLASMRSNASLGSFGARNQLSVSSLGNMGLPDSSVSRNQVVASSLGGGGHMGSLGRGSQLSLPSLGSFNRESQVPLGANGQSVASSVESNLQSYLGASRQSLTSMTKQSMQRSLGTNNTPLPSLGNNPSLPFPGTRINSLAYARNSTLLPRMQNPSVASHVDGPSSSFLFSQSGFPSPSQAGNIQLNQALASSRPIPHPGSLLLSEAPTPLLLAALSANRSYSATGVRASVRTAPVLCPASTSQVSREVNELSANVGTRYTPIANTGHSSEDSDEDPDMEAASNLKVTYHAQRWRARFQELCHFVQKHGHSLVPQHKHGKNVELARWVKRQRYQYKLMVDAKESNMTPERVEALESIGFAWDAHDAAWNERLLELKLFYKRHGHCDVSISDASHQRLTSWVKCQRRQYKFFQEGKESSLTPKRMSKLNDLGFSWNVRDVTMR